MFLLLCTEILSRRKPTVVLQSSTYKGNDVSLANDWNLNFKELDCSPNNINQTQTRFQVDLGKPYSISNVQIYRPDGRSNILVTAL